MSFVQVEEEALNPPPSLPASACCVGRAAVLLSSLLPGHVQSAWPSLQLALALAVLTRHPYW